MADVHPPCRRRATGLAPTLFKPGTALCADFCGDERFGEYRPRPPLVPAGPPGEGFGVVVPLLCSVAFCGDARRCVRDDDDIVGAPSPPARSSWPPTRRLERAEEVLSSADIRERNTSSSSRTAPASSRIREREAPTGLLSACLSRVTRFSLRTASSRRRNAARVSSISRSDCASDSSIDARTSCRGEATGSFGCRNGFPGLVMMAID